MAGDRLSARAALEQEAVQSGGTLPAAVVRALAASIAETPSAIHGADALHRDLTPSNVLPDTDGPKAMESRPR